MREHLQMNFVSNRNVRGFLTWSETAEAWVEKAVCLSLFNPSTSFFPWYSPCHIHRESYGRTTPSCLAGSRAYLGLANRHWLAHVRLYMKILIWHWPRLTAKLGLVWFSSGLIWSIFCIKSFVGITRQNNGRKFTIFGRKPQSHVGILIYLKWTIVNKEVCEI